MKKKKPLEEMSGKELIKEVNRRIRLARSYWDNHRNQACRRERDAVLKIYETLTKEQKDQIPQTLRVWLRYRSEKYFGEHRTAPGKKKKLS
ncbi:Precorrin-3B methylase [Akkermansiaceae bacterium]|nr:Precorrin-3B methylase [Akkermansiaceae bacterium]